MGNNRQRRKTVVRSQGAKHESRLSTRFKPGLLPSALRLLPCCAYLVTRLESVTDPGLGENVLWVGGIRLELLAQLADEDAQIFSLFSVIAAPDRAEQLVVGEHCTRVLNHEKEQFELFGCEVYLVSFDQDFVSGRINLEIPHFNQGRLGSLAG